MGSVGKLTRYKKNIQNWENLNFLIFLTHFRTVTIWNKIQCPLQGLLQLGSTVLKTFFKDNTSPIARLYGCIMVKLWVTKHSSFMKNFVSFTMKNIHPFDVSSIEIDLFLLKSTVFEFFQWNFLQLKRNCSKHIS